jgi:hypothetical protein
MVWCLKYSIHFYLFIKIHNFMQDKSYYNLKEIIWPSISCKWRWFSMLGKFISCLLFLLIRCQNIFILFIVFNATFSNISAISWWPVLVVDEAKSTWREPPDFVNYKKGALDSQPQVIKFTSCLPIVVGSLRIFRLLPPLKLVAMI